MEQLTAELGSPDFRRSEPPGEVWQYRGADCVLDVFLLRQNGGYRVISSAVRDRHGSAPPDHCAEAPVQGRQSLARPAAARENDRAAHLFPD